MLEAAWKQCDAGLEDPRRLTGRIARRQNRRQIKLRAQNPA